MQRQSYDTSSNPVIHVSSAGGDLQVAGWERLEFSLKSNGEELDVTRNEETFEVQCDDDLILYVPQFASVSIDSVGGDMDLRAMEGPVQIGSVGGDLQVRSVGSLHIDHVGGDLNLRGASGDCQVNAVGGDSSVKDVEGNLSLMGVGADAYIRQVLKDVQVGAGADVVLYLDPEGKREYQISAGSSVLLRLPADTGATLDLTAGGPASIRIDMPKVDAAEVMAQGLGQVVLGNGESRIQISAGDEIVITHRAEEWASMAEFGPDAWDSHDFPGVPPIPPIPPIPPVPGLEGLGERINERLSGKLEKIGERLGEQTRRRTEASMRRAEAAIRRAEQKMRAAEQRSRFSGFSGRPKVVVDHNLKFRPVQPAADPVSDEERLTILRMLEEKKISLKEAESLLAALDGK